jgi:hypothetical protein
MRQMTPLTLIGLTRRGQNLLTQALIMVMEAKEVQMG